MKRENYIPLSAYGLIGNTHTAALVSTDCSIDWCCLPHFDSGAVFCRLLDAESGGYFRISPVGKCSVSRRYAEGTTVLVTEFQASTGSARVTDFMHTQRIAQTRIGIDETYCHRLLRLVEGLSGRLEFELIFKPTFDFAQEPPELVLTPEGGRASSRKDLLLLRLRPALELRISGGEITGRTVVEPGTRVWVELSYSDSETGSKALVEGDPEVFLDETYRHWREWDRLCTYAGPYEEQVRLSARVLKLLTFGPTGAVIAAPTTSLPEEVGGVRNWDYRFCWLRDSALILDALMSLGFHEAAMDFFGWLERLSEGECERLQIVYRLDGGSDLPERDLPHLAGYRNSTPVRIGNRAAMQTQTDVYGHVLDAALVCYERMSDERMRPIHPELWRVLHYLADQAASNWREPDHGFWEVRGEPRQFLSSKLFCWVALDRALRLAATANLRGDVALWERERDAIRQMILEEGYDRSIRAFTQAPGTGVLDATALLLPLVGLLPASDERVKLTVERIQERLTSNSLVHRYLADDGLPGTEATFAICSFWLVDNLALQGKTDEARALFERVAGYANDLGLLAEEIDPVNHQLLGNYPQGFTHLALIGSALTIAKMEEALRNPAGRQKRAVLRGRASAS